jgi:hypothetical protein
MSTIAVILNGMCPLSLFAVFRVWSGQFRAKATVLGMLLNTGNRVDSIGRHHFHRALVLT